VKKQAANRVDNMLEERRVKKQAANRADDNMSEERTVLLERNFEYSESELLRYNKRNVESTRNLFKNCKNESAKK